MLVLSRKVDERIRIGKDVYITVVRIDSDKVRIGIEAPRSVEVVRTEIIDHHETPPTEVSHGCNPTIEREAGDQLGHHRANHEGAAHAD